MFFSSCIRSILNPKLVDNIKRTLGFASFDVDYELSKISRLGRFKTGETNLIQPNFRFIDSESFINQFIEIYRNDILSFNTDRSNPLVLDCGSNVGVSVCYFKSIFPSSKIIAFEPDLEIFSVLEHNTRCFDPSELEIHNKAVWTEETKLSFQSDGADGGRLLNHGKQSVCAVKLSDYLQTKVDMLKIDIEGAENQVIPNLLKKKIFPTQILVEFDELATNFIFPYLKALTIFLKLKIHSYELVKTNQFPNFLFVKK